MKKHLKHILSAALVLLFIFACSLSFITQVKAQSSFTCADGSEVSDPVDCPIGTLCGDGSTVYPPNECPIGTQCWDGSTVYPYDVCPTETQTCPDGSVIPITEECPDDTTKCGGVDKPTGGGNYECCFGNNVTLMGEAWCNVSGARMCRNRNICGSDPSPSNGGTCSGRDQVCAVSVSNSCSNDAVCDTAIHCTDGSTVYPPETCPDDGTCPDINGNYADSCELFLCPDGISTTHDETLSDCPQPQTCSDGRVIYPPEVCNDTKICSYQVVLEYSSKRLLYRGIYSKTIPIAQNCVLPTDAQILDVMQYILDPLPDQIPPVITPDTGITEVDQCPGPDFPGDQSVQEFISHGYRRDAEGLCVLDGICSTTVNTCLSETAATDISENTTTYNWTCPGQYGGNDTSCSKSKSVANGVCGGVAGICTSGTADPVTPTLSDGAYHWSCLGSDNGATSDDATCTGCTALQNLCGGLLQNGTCSTDKYCPASGTCVPANQSCPVNLITQFNMVPHIVATSTESCQATWAATLSKDINGNDIGGCTINGVSVPPASSAPKAPGTYVFNCETNGVVDTKTSRCEVTPAVIER